MNVQLDWSHVLALGFLRRGEASAKTRTQLSHNISRIFHTHKLEFLVPSHNIIIIIKAKL